MNEKLKAELLAGLQKVTIMQATTCTHCSKFATCPHLTEKFQILEAMKGEFVETLNKPMGELVATLNLAEVLSAVCDELEMIAAYNKRAKPTEYTALMNDIETLEIVFGSMTEVKAERVKVAC